MTRAFGQFLIFHIELQHGRYIYSTWNSTCKRQRARSREQNCYPNNGRPSSYARYQTAVSAEMPDKLVRCTAARGTVEVNAFVMTIISSGFTHAATILCFRSHMMAITCCWWAVIGMRMGWRGKRERVDADAAGPTGQWAAKSAIGSGQGRFLHSHSSFVPTTPIHSRTPSPSAATSPRRSTTKTKTKTTDDDADASVLSHLRYRQTPNVVARALSPYYAARQRAASTPTPQPQCRSSPPHASPSLCSRCR